MPGSMTNFINFSQKARLCALSLLSSSGCEEAAANLEGGLRATLEGLTLSDIPCADTLSVAGLLVILALFPGREEVYSEGEKSPFSPKDPLLFNPSVKSVINAGLRHAVPG